MAHFREQVFVSLLGQMRVTHAAMLLRSTQDIADKCCNEWGHEWPVSPRRVKACRRCGRRLVDVETSVRTGRPAGKPEEGTLSTLARLMAPEEEPKPKSRISTTITRGERRVFGRAR